MKARDTMVSPVITVRGTSSVMEAAKIMLDRRISALPVVDEKGKLIGIVSEGDLVRRAETGTDRSRSWWLRILTGEEILAAEFIKSHAKKIADVMTGNVVTASPDTPLVEIATLLEKHGIKRVPIVKDGQLVGIVSRANLVQALASASAGLTIALSDETIREELLAQLKTKSWAHTSELNVTVHGGIVDLWGRIYSENEQRAIRIAAENTPGVRVVNDHMFLRPTLGDVF